MNKRLIISVFLAFFAGTVSAASVCPSVTAHRGGHIKGLIPENSIAGISSAARFGYGAVECDPKATSDGVIVVMHDKTINRTMRLKDGYREIRESVKVSDLTFGELRSGYVLASDDESQRVRIPTLEEMCLECKRVGMKMMVHTSLEEAVRTVHRILGEDWICFSSSRDILRFARNEGFNGLCLYSTEERDVNDIAAFLDSIGKPCGISSMDRQKDKHPENRLYTPEFIKALTSKGFEVQASIFSVPWEQRAVREGVTMVLSDKYWLPAKGMTPCQQWDAPNGKYTAGAVLEHNFDYVPECGAITFALSFKGKLNLWLNGRAFQFSHEGFSTETAGLRFYGTTPSLRIETDAKTVLKTLQVKVFDLH